MAALDGIAFWLKRQFTLCLSSYQQLMFAFHFNRLTIEKGKTVSNIFKTSTVTLQICFPTLNSLLFLPSPFH